MSSNATTYNHILSKGIEADLPLSVGMNKLRFTTDTGRLYLDNEGTDRVEISDFIKGYTKDQILSILAPLPKIYLASDTQELYYYDDGWKSIASTTVNASTADYAIEAGHSINADTATFATNASTAEYTKNATSATYKTLAEYEALSTADKNDPLKIYFVINEGTKTTPTLEFDDGNCDSSFNNIYAWWALTGNPNTTLSLVNGGLGQGENCWWSYHFDNRIQFSKVSFSILDQGAGLRCYVQGSNDNSTWLNILNNPSGYEEIISREKTKYEFPLNCNGISYEYFRLYFYRYNESGGVHIYGDTEVFAAATSSRPLIYYKNILYTEYELPNVTVSDTGKTLIVNDNGVWDKGDLIVSPTISDVGKVLTATDVNSYGWTEVGTYTAGTGLSLSGSTFSIDPNASTVTYATSAGTATNATSSSYASNGISNITRNETNFTVTRADGSTFEFDQQDNNTTYTVAIDGGLSLSGNSFSIDTNASTAKYAYSAGTADSANNAGTASYAEFSGSATNADTASYAYSANTANTAGSATNAQFSSNADTATYAISAGNANTAGTANSANTATNASTADYAVSANTATSATNASTSDYAKNTINTIERNGLTFTATRNDGSSFTFSQQDNNTTYAAGTDLTLNSGTFNHSTSVTAGTAGTSSATSGSTLAVPYVTYNNRGHITATGTHTHTVTGFIASSLKGANNGVAELGSDGKVPTSQLPSYVDDVLEYDDLSKFPATGEAGKIYVAKDTNKTYRWSGTTYVEISPSLALGETDSTAYRGDRGKIAYDHSQAAHAPSNAEKNQNAFSNVVVGSSTVAADTTTDTLTLVAGTNVSLTPDATNDSITIAATDTKYTNGTGLSLTGTTFSINANASTVAYATKAGSATSAASATNASSATYATSAGSATSATNATNASSAKYATNSSTAEYAKKAAADESGNNIKSSYASSVTVSGHTLTIYNKNGSSLATATLPNDNTDTKVTAVGNHYTPTTNNASSVSVSAAGGSAATWGSTQLVTGVTLKRDAAYHVTGLEVNSIQLPSNPNTDTKVTSVDNHYAPSTNNASSISVAASGGTATWNTDVVKGVTIKRDAKGHVTGLEVSSVKIPANPNTNTTYSFTSGTNCFGVTPSSGTASTVTVTPSIANNVTGSGTSGYIAKWNGAHTVTNGPAFGSATTTYLRNDGSWATPTDTKNTAGSTDTSSKIFLVGATSQAANPQTYSDNEVYATSGVLTTKSIQVGGGAATIQYNSNTQSIDFVFA
jgi:hypothetical protein